MSHDPAIEKYERIKSLKELREKNKCIDTMMKKAQLILEAFPILVKNQALTYSLALDIPIDEEKTAELIKAELVSIMVDIDPEYIKGFIEYLKYTELDLEETAEAFRESQLTAKEIEENMRNYVK